MSLCAYSFVKAYYSLHAFLLHKALFMPKLLVPEQFSKAINFYGGKYFFAVLVTLDLHPSRRIFYANHQRSLRLYHYIIPL